MKDKLFIVCLIGIIAACASMVYSNLKPIETRISFEPVESLKDMFVRKVEEQKEKLRAEREEHE